MYVIHFVSQLSVLALPQQIIYANLRGIQTCCKRFRHLRRIAYISKRFK